MISRRALLTLSASLIAFGAKMNISKANTQLTNAKAAGFKAPEEAAPHERTFMQWPVSLTVYGTRDEVEYIQEDIARVANTISKFEPVVMLAAKEHHASARMLLSEKVELWDIATEDLWCRDSGPLFLLNQEELLAASNLNFNGWGNKQIHKNDGLIAEKICERLGVPVFNNGLVGESGGIEFDGISTLFGHESSWVNPNRNKQSRDEISELLMQAYGASKVIWSPGVAGADITDYHIDSLARFSEPGVIFLQRPQELDPSDPWSRAAFETLAILESETDEQGNPFEIIDIFEPLNTRVKSKDFVAAYPNYYVCNGAVVCAEFGDEEADIIAKRTLEELFPDRVVVPIKVDALGEAGGGIHCATQQQPKSKGNWRA